MKTQTSRFGHRLRTIRNLKGIEPVAMADALSVSESTYRRYERDESEPTLSVLRKIADIFEIGVADLIEDNMDISLPVLRTV